MEADLQENIPQKEVRPIFIRYGFMAAGAYVIYFMIMKLAGLIEQTELRFVNYLIYAFFAYLALQAVRGKGNGTIDYLQGMGISFLTGVLSFVLLGAFIFIFSFLNTDFLGKVMQEVPTGFGVNMTPFGAALLVASEGIAMSAIISLCMMQYFKGFSSKKSQALFDKNPSEAPDKEIWKSKN